jgi:hypothetical protein
MHFLRLTLLVTLSIHVVGYQLSLSQSYKNVKFNVRSLTMMSDSSKKDVDLTDKLLNKVLKSDNGKTPQKITTTVDTSTKMVPISTEKDGKLFSFAPILAVSLVVVPIAAFLVWKNMQSDNRLVLVLGLVIW